MRSVRQVGFRWCTPYRDRQGEIRDREPGDPDEQKDADDGERDVDDRLHEFRGALQGIHQSCESRLLPLPLLMTVNLELHDAFANVPTRSKVTHGAGGELRYVHRLVLPALIIKEQAKRTLRVCLVLAQATIGTGRLQRHSRPTAKRSAHCSNVITVESESDPEMKLSNTMMPNRAMSRSERIVNWWSSERTHRSSSIRIGKCRSSSMILSARSIMFILSSTLNFKRGAAGPNSACLHMPLAMFAPLFGNQYSLQSR